MNELKKPCVVWTSGGEKVTINSLLKQEYYWNIKVFLYREEVKQQAGGNSYSMRDITDMLQNRWYPTTVHIHHSLLSKIRRSAFLSSSERWQPARLQVPLMYRLLTSCQRESVIITDWKHILSSHRPEAKNSQTNPSASGNIAICCHQQ